MAPNTITSDNNLTDWPSHFMAAHPLRSKSVVMTLFGDVILPHGGALWLGSLIRLLAPFGMSDRLVRTSVYRLAEEGWLKAKRQGRRSLYTLNSAAAHRFKVAYRRIYTPSYLAWDGRWTQVMTLPHLMDADQRALLRKELIWEGFGALSPTALIHPNPDFDTLNNLLARLKLQHQVFVAQLKATPQIKSRALHELVDHCWDLHTVTEEYQHFLSWFSTLPQLINASKKIEPELAFVLRTLLIHEFRRIQLHDPLLPIELLPQNWVGKAAYELCREIYQLLYKQANDYALQILRLEDEKAPPAEANFYQRFGGLN